MIPYSCTIILFLTIIPYTLPDPNYSFIPESRDIEVNEGESYEISFVENETTDFDYCYYHDEDNNFDGSYPIIKNETTTDDDDKVRNFEDEDSNTLTPYNKTTICGFLFMRITAESPKKWTIIVHDKKNSLNYTETVTITVYYNIEPLLKTINALPTTSYYNYLNTNSPLEKCQLFYNNSTIVDLDLSSTEAKFENEDTDLKDRLSSLGNLKKCGFKIIKTTLEDPKEYTFLATDKDGKKYRTVANIHIFPVDGETMKNRTEFVYLGASVFVNCGKIDPESSNTDQQYCQLYNPMGELIAKSHLCQYNLDIVRVEDLGVWFCYVGYDFTMDSLYFTTELIENKNENVEVWVEHFPDYISIGCKLRDFETVQLNYCRFTRQSDGRQFKAYLGAATERYTTIETDLTNGKCGLEISKPIQNEDRGMWKCEAFLVDGSDGTTGGFITVDNTNLQTVPAEKSPDRKFIYLGNSVEIDCQVEFSSDYCFIVAPNGTQYHPTDKLATKLGRCHFSIETTTMTDNGKWICFYSMPNGIADYQMSIEVAIVEMTVDYADVAASLDANVKLHCNSGGLPLEYCRFSSPIGLSYSLRKSEANLNRISYTGRGLEYGDCGIEIHQAQEYDAGDWICQISAGRMNYGKKTDIIRRISLKINNSNEALAESMGISMGVLAVVIIAAAFAIYHYHKRRRRNLSNALNVRFDANRESQSSGDSIIITPQNTYNTND